jgi:hypothetical protein
MKLILKNINWFVFLMGILAGHMLSNIVSVYTISTSATVCQDKTNVDKAMSVIPAEKK